jgi:glycyl-tRNA synthetase beta chain
MSDFLLEIGLEEIPARMIAAAQAELARRVHALLTRERLIAPESEIYSYSTPRRLAVLISGVLAAQADTEEQLTGPSWAVAFKNGEPTPAAHAFAKKAGVDLSELQKVTTPKGEYVGATALRKGRATAEILTAELPKEIAAIYWPKNMYWREGKPERFVRPVKWLLALLDHAIVPIEFAGVHAANLTYGHRILHGDSAIPINHPADYLGALEAAFVTADVELRRHRIRKALDAETRTVPEARWREDEPLVDTVTHLTEWPSVLLGSFESEYLALPEEVLVTVMRDHQKYFAVEDASGKLAPYFLTVLNTHPEEHALEIIRHGNERVLRARFNDARFFWNVDQKIQLNDRVEMLKSVTFHKDLGSYYDKTEANMLVAKSIAYRLRGLNLAIDEGGLERAVRLAKTDLTSELVKEFTELQGIVGGYYARAQGEPDVVATAIRWQYLPASAKDKIPPTIEGQILGLADRMRTIMDMFVIGNIPSGSKDPYGLRRAGNAVITILAESGLPLELRNLFLSYHLHADQSPKEANQFNEFWDERMGFYLRDVRGFAYDVVNAVLAASWNEVRDVIARAEQLTAMRGSEDLLAVGAAFKRIKNILRQARENGVLNPGQDIGAPSPDLLQDPAEQALYAQARRLAPIVNDLRTRSEYRQALEQIATLRPHVDLFFDKVMVMAEDPTIRQNRLALIARVLTSFSSIADFSELVSA